MYTILVVDDEKDIVSALESYLKAEGYRVLSACNGKEALAAAAREDVHLILMDIMMPVMDGLSAMAQLRQTSNVPVILLTAKGEDTDKVLGLNVGADDYITKPFNPVELRARVRSQLRRYLQLGGGQVQASTLIIGGICLDDNAKPVTDDQVFTVVLNNYRFNGGGDYVKYLNDHGCPFVANDPDRIIYSSQFDMINGEDEGQARSLLDS